MFIVMLFFFLSKWLCYYKKINAKNDFDFGKIRIEIQWQWAFWWMEILTCKRERPNLTLIWLSIFRSFDALKVKFALLHISFSLIFNSMFWNTFFFNLLLNFPRPLCFPFKVGLYAILHFYRHEIHFLHKCWNLQLASHLSNLVFITCWLIGQILPVCDCDFSDHWRLTGQILFLTIFFSSN